MLQTKGKHYIELHMHASKKMKRVKTVDDQKNSNLDRIIRCHVLGGNSFVSETMPPSYNALKKMIGLHNMNILKDYEEKEEEEQEEEEEKVKAATEEPENRLTKEVLNELTDKDKEINKLSAQNTQCLCGPVRKYLNYPNLQTLICPKASLRVSKRTIRRGKDIYDLHAPNVCIGENAQNSCQLGHLHPSEYPHGDEMCLCCKKPIKSPCIMCTNTTDTSPIIDKGVDKDETATSEFKMACATGILCPIIKNKNCKHFQHAHCWTNMYKNESSPYCPIDYTPWISRNTVDEEPTPGKILNKDLLGTLSQRQPPEDSRFGTLRYRTSTTAENATDATIYTMPPLYTNANALPKGVLVIAKNTSGSISSFSSFSFKDNDKSLITVFEPPSLHFRHMVEIMVKPKVVLQCKMQNSVFSAGKLEEALQSQHRYTLDKDKVLWLCTLANIGRPQPLKKADLIDLAQYNSSKLLFAVCSYNSENHVLPFSVSVKAAQHNSLLKNLLVTPLSLNVNLNTTVCSLLTQIQTSTNELASLLTLKLPNTGKITSTEDTKEKQQEKQKEDVIKKETWMMGKTKDYLSPITKMKDLLVGDFCMKWKNGEFEAIGGEGTTARNVSEKMSLEFEVDHISPLYLQELGRTLHTWIGGMPLTRNNYKAVVEAVDQQLIEPKIFVNMVVQYNHQCLTETGAFKGTGSSINEDSNFQYVQSAFSAGAHWLPQNMQTSRGISAFLSCLYILSQTMSREGEEACKRAVGLFRQATGNFEPAVAALRCVMMGRYRELSKADCKLLVETIYNLMLTHSLIPPTILDNRNQVLEYSRIFFSWLLASSQLDHAALEDKKNYQTIATKCGLSLEPLVNPVSYIFGGQLDKNESVTQTPSLQMIPIFNAASVIKLFKRVALEKIDLFLALQNQKEKEIEKEIEIEALLVSKTPAKKSDNGPLPKSIYLPEVWKSLGELYKLPIAFDEECFAPEVRDSDSYKNYRMLFADEDKNKDKDKNKEQKEEENNEDVHKDREKHKTNPPTATIIVVDKQKISEMLDKVTTLGPKWIFRPDALAAAQCCFVKSIWKAVDKKNMDSETIDTIEKGAECEHASDQKNMDTADDSEKILGAKNLVSNLLLKKDKMQLSIQLPSDWKRLVRETALVDETKCFRYCHPQRLENRQGSDSTALTFNERAFIVVYTGRGKGTNVANIYDPICGSETSVNPIELSTKLNTYLGASTTPPEIAAIACDSVDADIVAPPKEGILLLVDTSMSMSDVGGFKDEQTDPEFIVERSKHLGRWHAPTHQLTHNRADSILESKEFKYSDHAPTDEDKELNAKLSTLDWFRSLPYFDHLQAIVATGTPAVIVLQECLGTLASHRTQPPSEETYRIISKYRKDFMDILTSPTSALEKYTNKPQKRCKNISPKDQHQVHNEVNDNKDDAENREEHEQKKKKKKPEQDQKQEQDEQGVSEEEQEQEWNKGRAEDGFSVAFLCPILKKSMVNPVTTMNGQTYEKQAIESWFLQCARSGLAATDPLSGVILADKRLVPNYTLKKSILEWKGKRTKRLIIEEQLKQDKLKLAQAEEQKLKYAEGKQKDKEKDKDADTDTNEEKQKQSNLGLQYIMLTIEDRPSVLLKIPLTEITTDNICDEYLHNLRVNDLKQGLQRLFDTNASSQIITYDGYTVSDTTPLLAIIQSNPESIWHLATADGNLVNKDMSPWLYNSENTDKEKERKETKGEGEEGEGEEGEGEEGIDFDNESGDETDIETECTQNHDSEGEEESEEDENEEEEDEEDDDERKIYFKLKIPSQHKAPKSIIKFLKNINTMRPCVYISVKSKLCQLKKIIAGSLRSRETQFRNIECSHLHLFQGNTLIKNNNQKICLLNLNTNGGNNYDETNATNPNLFVKISKRFYVHCKSLANEKDTNDNSDDYVNGLDNKKMGKTPSPSADFLLRQSAMEKKEKEDFEKTLENLMQNNAVVVVRKNGFNKHAKYFADEFKGYTKSSNDGAQTATKMAPLSDSTFQFMADRNDTVETIKMRLWRHWTSKGREEPQYYPTRCSLSVVIKKPTSTRTYLISDTGTLNDAFDILHQKTRTSTATTNGTQTHRERSYNLQYQSRDQSQDQSAPCIYLYFEPLKIDPNRRLSRMDATKQLILAFLNRSQAYGYQVHLGLAPFNDEPYNMRCDFTGLYDRFRDQLDTLSPSGQTSLYEALFNGMQSLTEWRKRYPSATSLRIIVISDGKDTSSKTKPHLILHALQKAKVKVDSILIGDEQDQNLRAISEFSGGMCFAPETLKDCLGLMEMEPFLYSNCRPPPKLKQGLKIENERQYLDYVEKINGISGLSGGYVNALPQIALPFEIKMKSASVEKIVKSASSDFHGQSISLTCPSFEKQSLSDPLTPYIPSAWLWGQGLNSNTKTTTTATATATTGTTATTATTTRGIAIMGSNDGKEKRIMRELKKWMQDSHPHIALFPVCDNIMFWKGIVQGPEGDLYQGGVWPFHIQFPADYPFSAPTIRFDLPIRHPNFSPNGRVCHSVLDRNYNHMLSIKDILNNIYGLLLHPEYDDAINSSLTLDYYQDPGNYAASVLAHTKTWAGQASWDEWVKYLDGSANKVPVDVSTLSAIATSHALLGRNGNHVATKGESKQEQNTVLERKDTVNGFEEKSKPRIHTHRRDQISLNKCSSCEFDITDLDNKNIMERDEWIVLESNIKRTLLCQRCKKVTYCSDLCKKLHSAEHNKECRR